MATLNRFLTRLGAPFALALGLISSPETSLGQTFHDCRSDIAVAEIRYSIPPGLLQAIANVESRYRYRNHPWALNINGQPYYPGTFEEAASMLRGDDGKPILQAAVGCMQIYMKYHLGAFAGMPEYALHPHRNINYAALYLIDLRKRFGSWQKAVPFYHATHNLPAQQDYLCAVAKELTKLDQPAWVQCQAGQ